jgi:hypothetical protein
MALEGQDKEIAGVHSRADRMLLSILEDAGIPREHFEAISAGGADVSLEELAGMMEGAWAVHARVAAREEEWATEVEDRKRTLEAEGARAYVEATGALPKGTETAKRNWIVSNCANVTALEGRVAEADYLRRMHKAARKSLEERCDLLQSINKLKVAEMSRLGINVGKSPPPPA